MAEPTNRRDYVVAGNLKPAGFQQITSLGTAVGLTVPTTKPAPRIAYIQSEDQHVRWRDDGTNPTASVGNRILTTGEGFWYTGDLDAIKFIEETASGKLNVSYYG